jgi:hypothetical protein
MHTMIHQLRLRHLLSRTLLHWKTMSHRQYQQSGTMTMNAHITGDRSAMKRALAIWRSLVTKRHHDHQHNMIAYRFASNHLQQMALRHWYESLLLQRTDHTMHKVAHHHYHNNVIEMVIKRFRRPIVHRQQRVQAMLHQRRHQLMHVMKVWANSTRVSALTRIFRGLSRRWLLRDVFTAWQVLLIIANHSDRADTLFHGMILNLCIAIIRAST